MIPHNFFESFDYEKSWLDRADAFYLSKYPQARCIRFDSNSDRDMIYQRKDIDLTIELETKSVHISEKFRSEDYGDLLVEIYSKYPDKKGWMENSEADVIAYFASSKVYFVDKKLLLDFYQSEILNSNIEDELKLFYQNQSSDINSKKIDLKLISGKTLSLRLIRAYNQVGINKWQTISIAISWENLASFGVPMKKYSLI